MIQEFKSLATWQKFRKSLVGSLGFVPTMGALHAGHLKLVNESQSENDHTLVSIYVNPTQFNDPQDFEKYPQTLEADRQLLNKTGDIFLLLPQYSEIYADSQRFKVVEEEKSKVLCGAHRPGHFDGVLTVVMKLLHLAQAHRAYFGEKDFQQLVLIREMAESFFLATEVRGVPTVREASGLAMSSRNERLSPQGRREAALLFELLSKRAPLAQLKKDLERAGFKVDYFEERWGRRFVAAFKDGVRLIDNIPWLENNEAS